MSPAMTISKLAQAARVNVESVRYYQRRGLLDEPQKPHGGVRQYATQHVRRVLFIKRAQTLGFTLAEIAHLLQLDEANNCAETQEFALDKLALIEQKLSDLTAIRKALLNLLAQCDSTSTGISCPILDSLSGN
ncbi:Hg(II)-responsive transcriptional regulator [bacterium]|nr:Hg(II)-responsive transcriptional regulator [bacterium]